MVGRSSHLPEVRIRDGCHRGHPGHRRDQAHSPSPRQGRSCAARSGRVLAQLSRSPPSIVAVCDDLIDLRLRSGVQFLPCPDSSQFDPVRPPRAAPELYRGSVNFVDEFEKPAAASAKVPFSTIGELCRDHFWTHLFVGKPMVTYDRNSRRMSNASSVMRIEASPLSTVPARARMASMFSGTTIASL